MSKIVCNKYLLVCSLAFLIFFLSIFAIFTCHFTVLTLLLVRWQWGVGVTSASEMVRVPPLPVIPHLTQHPGDTVSPLSQCQSLTSPVSRWWPCEGVNNKCPADVTERQNQKVHCWNGCMSKECEWIFRKWLGQKWSTRQVLFTFWQKCIYCTFCQRLSLPIVVWTAMFFCLTLTVSINFIVREISISDLYFLSR